MNEPKKIWVVTKSKEIFELISSEKRIEGTLTNGVLRICLMRKNSGEFLNLTLAINDYIQKNYWEDKWVSNKKELATIFNNHQFIVNIPSTLEFENLLAPKYFLSPKC